MRTYKTASVLVLLFGAAFGLTGSLAAGPRELVTAADAVLCIDAVNVDDANVGRTAKNQDMLRGLGCMRSPPGIPATLIRGSDGDGTWSVRLRPQGISGGITMWGRPSAFTLPDGTPLQSVRAENKIKTPPERGL